MNINRGCKCDPGYSGHDCSVRECPRGPDPRLSTSNQEVVKFVCTCPGGGCGGKFILRYMGLSTNTVLSPTSTAAKLATALMTAQGLRSSSSNSPYSISPITVTGADGTTTDTLCSISATKITTISFRLQRGDVPPIGLYANALTGGSIYFQTTQTLSCDCTSGSTTCKGNFRVGFDKQVSASIDCKAVASTVATALSSMATVTSAQVSGIAVVGGGTGPVCVDNAVTSTQITINAPFGNVPPIGLYSSVVTTSGSSLSTADTATPLTISTNDGNSVNMKLCNGVGSCNFQTGVCKCPFGFESDSDLGPCGLVTYNTSQFSGLSRCPGIVDYYQRDASGRWFDRQQKENYKPRLYLSLNPTYVSNSNQLYPSLYRNMTVSVIRWYNWPVNDRFAYAFPPFVDNKVDGVTVLNLTSNSSAGPILFDRSKNNLFFIDTHPVRPFIGKYSLSLGNGGVYTRFYEIAATIFGFTMDSRLNQRFLYWTVPGTTRTADGKIYKVSMDATAPVTSPTLLSTTIGQASVIDPKGIAIHFPTNKIYWVDVKLKVDGVTWQNVLSSCNLDGSGYYLFAAYENVRGHPVGSLTDIAINFKQNNTAYIIDTGNPGVIATNLDTNIQVNSTTLIDHFLYMMPMYVIANRTTMVTPAIKVPKYLFIDDYSSMVLWSDNTTIGYEYYLQTPGLYGGVAYGPKINPNDKNMQQPYSKDYLKPVGMYIDRGLGIVQFDGYQDCYGQGVCMGFSGNFICKCYDGYEGDCQAKTCPTGKAWWSEPAVNNIAHDEYIECSGRGACNKKTGDCICQVGYEGEACERMSCPITYNGDVPSYCNGNGRCLSMRSLALQSTTAEMISSPITYGSTPNSATTWDSDMIYTCAADTYDYIHDYGRIGSVSDRLLYDIYGNKEIKSYTGHDLSKIKCAQGTTNSPPFVPETYRLICNANSGWFTLKWRNLVSNPIYYSWSLTQLEIELQLFYKIGNVDVVFSTDQATSTPISAFNGTICSSNNYKIDIKIMEYATTHSLITVNATGDGFDYNTLYLQRYQLFQGVLAECSGNGLCDYTSGRCTCEPGFGPSDGYGNSGSRDDCGYFTGIGHSNMQGN